MFFLSATCDTHTYTHTHRHILAKIGATSLRGFTTSTQYHPHWHTIEIEREKNKRVWLRKPHLDTHCGTYFHSTESSIQGVTALSLHRHNQIANKWLQAGLATLFTILSFHMCVSENQAKRTPQLRSHKHSHKRNGKNCGYTHTHSIHARSRKYIHTFTCQTAMNMSIWRQAKNLYKRNYTNEKFLQPHMQDLHTHTHTHKTVTDLRTYIYVCMYRSTLVTVRCKMQKCNAFHGQTFCMLWNQ